MYVDTSSQDKYIFDTMGERQRNISSEDSVE